jgi:hypothetical protein
MYNLVVKPEDPGTGDRIILKRIKEIRCECIDCILLLQDRL